MSKFTVYFKKIALAVLVFAIGLAAIRLSALPQLACPLHPPRLPTRREPAVWNRPGPGWQATYQREGARLGKANEFIGKVQSLIDKGSQKGWGHFCRAGRPGRLDRGYPGRPDSP